MNLAETLNLGCLCRTLNPERLRQQMETDPTPQSMPHQPFALCRTASMDSGSSPE